MPSEAPLETSAPSEPVADSRAPVGRVALVVGTVAAVLAAFLFRFLSIEFTNDHFVHLSRGWEILQGEVPIRDFFDPGLILQYYASAAALLWSGHNLFGEALLTTGFISAGAGLTFIAAARLSRSFWVAAVATALAILSTPRLYGYPKVFFYVLAIVGAWHYTRRPQTRSLVVLAVITAIAFLFRHDHGVYIGIAVTTLLAVFHWQEPRRALEGLLRYGAVTILLLLPFLIFVQAEVGLFRYFGGVSPQVDRVTSVQFNALPISIDRSAPLLVVTAPVDLRINVRWQPDVDEEARHRLEAVHGLTKPDHVQESTWSYVPTFDDRDHIAKLVDDPKVADTHGIDRAARRLEISEPFYMRLQRWIPLFRMRLAPGVFSQENALAWFYYMTFLLPFACLALLAGLLWRGTVNRQEAAVVAMAAVLCLVIVQTLVRGSPDSRLADVANPTSVIGAWLWARTFRAASALRTPLRVLSTAAASAIALVTVWSVMTDGHVLENLEASRILTGPAGIVDRMGVVTGRLEARPIDQWQPADPGIPGLGRYVFECTAPTDRVFVTWFAPQVFFYTERRFAGGQVYLTANWHASIPDQQLTIERLEHQRVPIVLERVDAESPRRFPLVFDYLQQHYVDAPMSSDGMKLYRVRVDTRLQPTRTYEPLGLPCYR